MEITPILVKWVNFDQYNSMFSNSFFETSAFCVFAINSLSEMNYKFKFMTKLDQDF